MAEVKKLGRGLSALLGDKPAASLSPEQQRLAKPVPIEFLKPGKYQPRHYMDEDAIAALANSIQDKGVLQPLLVRRDPDDAQSYEIIAGERRWRAAQLAKLHEVPVIIKDLSDRDTMEVALIENVQREDLSAIEEADAYQRLMDEFSRTQEDVSKLVGKSRSHVANTLRLLGLPNGVKKLIEMGKLSAGHARTLIGSDNAEEIANKIIAKGLSVRQAEKLASQSSGTAKAKPASHASAPQKDVDTLALERDVSNILGMNIDIQSSGESGVLSISYRTLDQLDTLLAKLTDTTPRIVVDNDDVVIADEPAANKVPGIVEQAPKLSVSLKPKK